MIQAIALGLAIAGGLFMLRPKNMRMSQAGITALEKREVFVDHPYKDEAGIWTIGYGHVIKPGESFTVISPAQGTQLLMQDLVPAENAVNANVKVPLSQNMFDALTSFVFNVGVGAFQSSTLLMLLNQKDYVGASSELEKWKYVTVNGKHEVSNGLLARRASELNQFWA